MIKQMLSQEISGEPRITFSALALMFGIGLWLGLIVIDGATYLLLVLMLVCSYSLPRANALKVVLLVVTTFIAIAMFWSKGEVRLIEGSVLSVGSIAGGYFGAKLTGQLNARKWAFRILVFVIVLELVNLSWHYIAS